MVTDGVEYKWGLHPTCSIYFAEPYAILQALNYIDGQSNGWYIICSDSLSALSAITGNNKSSSDPLITKILITHHRLFEQCKQIILLWTPGHTGIRGNELADEAARQATESTITDVPLNTLLKPTIKKWSSPSLIRREQVVLTRLRIGHIFLTHSNLLLGNPPETCRRCEVLLTWNHIFLECPLYMATRVLFNLPDSIKDCLLSSSNIRTTLSFLKAIKHFRKA
nr:unnamed protein product [Callosobruchus analis]